MSYSGENLVLISYATLKVRCDIPKLRLVSGCQLCFRPLCIYWREIKNL